MCLLILDLDREPGVVQGWADVEDMQDARRDNEQSRICEVLSSTNSIQAGRLVSVVQSRIAR